MDDDLNSVRTSPNHEADFERAANQERLKLLCSLCVAITALLVLVALLGVGVARWSDAKDVAAVVSPLAAVVGTIAGGYLGHQAGSSGREREAAERRELAHQLVRIATGGNGGPRDNTSDD